jgi:hypothetical protein
MAFDPTNPNLRVWLDNERTDPAYTKPITGKKFGGTSLNGTYVAKRLTDAFGPVGMGWGYEATYEDVHFPSGQSLNFAMVRFWYHPNGCKSDDAGVLAPVGPRAEFTQVGGTELAGTYSSGKAFADDEARKKSLTDGLLKAASHIGIGGDIHLGRFDDSKYVEQRKVEEQQEAKQIATAANADLLREAQEVADALGTADDATTFHELRERGLKLVPALMKIDRVHVESMGKAVQSAAARLNITLNKKAA